MRKRSEATPEKAGVKEQVEQASSELAQALRDAENVDDPSFGDLPRVRGIHPGFERVVSRVFVEEAEFESTYEKLTSLLRALEGRNERAFWKDSLGRAAEGHHLATRLYVTAQKVLANWEADNALVTATMRERAYRELQREKEEGKRNKTVTDKDVDDRAALLYAMKWSGVQKQRGEYKLMVDELGMMVKSFDHLNNNLRALVGSQ
jgi:hypothetical protein